MLARLQQALTLGLLTLGLAWVIGAWTAGRPALAAAGALVLLGGHAAVLGLEFVLLAATRGGDPTPRASPGQLVAAWWGEVRAAPLVFCWQQPFRSRRWPDLLPADAHGHRGLVLIHGFVCNRGLWNPWLEALHRDGVPFVAVDLEPVFGSIDDYVAIVEDAVARVERATGRPPVVVAHSMGGLALRRWYAEQADAGRIAHAVTIATPHRGTWLARFAFTRNARQMRLDSRWLRALAAREAPERVARFTCFHGHCDNIAFPPATGTRIGADNRHLSAVAHVDMARHPAPWTEVRRLLETA